MRTSLCGNMSHDTHTRQNLSHCCWNIMIFLSFQDVGHLPSWICGVHFGMTHNVNLRGLYHCAKFGLNRCSSFASTNVWIFCIFGRKQLFAPHKGSFGASDPLNRCNIDLIPIRNITVWKYITTDISSKSVKLLMRYDIAIFLQDGGHLWDPFWGDPQYVLRSPYHIIL